MGGAGTRYVGLGSMHVRMCGVCLLYTSTLLCVAACVQNVFAKNVFDVEPLPPVCRFCVTVTKKKRSRGYYEFPGGKVEEGETDGAALVRYSETVGERGRGREEEGAGGRGGACERGTQAGREKRKPGE